MSRSYQEVDGNIVRDYDNSIGRIATGWIMYVQDEWNKTNYALQNVEASSSRTIK